VPYTLVITVTEETKGGAIEMIQRFLFNLTTDTMKYIYIGAVMLLASTIMSIIYDWRLTLIIFLAVQGNTIVQEANKRINNVNQ
jgi:hypothetical protein